MTTWTAELETRLLEFREKYPDDWQKTARALGRTVTACRKKWRKLQEAAVKPKPSVATVSRRRSMSRQEFLAANDADTRVRLAIRKAVKELDADEILKDGEFRSMCAAPAGNWRQVSDEPEFLKYQFILDGRRFWATPKTVDWACTNVAKARRAE